MFHYYWRDPCPIMGSGLLDYDRRPYLVYDALRAAYTRVLISLERDAKPYVIGREKVYERGTSFSATVWVTNDHPQPIDGAQVSWEIAGVDDEIVTRNDLEVTIAADAAQEVDRIGWAIPMETAPGDFRVSMHVRGPDGGALSDNATDIVVR